MQFMQRYREVGVTFLQQIFTGDETWEHHGGPASKRQSMEWKYTSSPRTKKYINVPSAEKSDVDAVLGLTRIVDRQSRARYCAVLEE